MKFSKNPIRLRTRKLQFIEDDLTACLRDLVNSKSAQDTGLV